MTQTASWGRRFAMEIRMPLTLVTQANLTDCGLACTAIVARQKLETVLRVAIKECGYPKDGPHTTTDENLLKLLDYFGIKYGIKKKVKTVAELPDVAIMETRKMPSTGNSHLVVFERTADGDEHVLDPGWWLKQQVRNDWNRIKLDTFIPIYLSEPTLKSSQKKPKPIQATKANEGAANTKLLKQAKPPKVKPNGKNAPANTFASAEQQKPTSNELNTEPKPVDAAAVVSEPESGARRLHPSTAVRITPESAGQQGTDDAC